MAELETQIEEELTPGSEEYNASMANKFTNQDKVDADPEEKLPVVEMPENGQEKFYDAETGEYDWQNHAKELEYRLNKNEKPKDAPDGLTDSEREEALATPEYQAQDIVQRAGLDAAELRGQLEADGDLSEEAYVALEKQGLRRDIVELYVDNMNYRRDQQTTAALEYAGGEGEWNNLAAWAARNLPHDEGQRYNELLSTPEWKVAIDALKVRRESANTEPNMINGGKSQSGGQFGYRSRAEMKADMTNPMYASDPAFRESVMQKIQSATWDLGQNFRGTSVSLFFYPLERGSAHRTMDTRDKMISPHFINHGYVYFPRRGDN